MLGRFNIAFVIRGSGSQDTDGAFHLQVGELYDGVPSYRRSECTEAEAERFLAAAAARRQESFTMGPSQRHTLHSAGASTPAYINKYQEQRAIIDNASGRA